MIQLTTDLGDAILAHARECSPAECCGVVLDRGDGLVYVPCSNAAAADGAKDRFIIDKHDWVAAEDAGEVVAVVHSHPNASAHASHADLVGIEETGLPWIIISLPSGVLMQFEPTGQRLPLLGRVFFHGIVDCYSLVRDYFFTRLAIDLPNFERPDDWWKKVDGQPGQDLYRKNFALAGFVEVGLAADVEPRPHDVILMEIRSDQPNHAAVMDAEKPGHIIHHIHSRLSCHDVWGGAWRHCATSVLRHRDLLEAAHG